MHLSTKRTGKVYLVGAGPGDPELITVKGLELIRRADVIVHDRLVDPALLGHAREGAEIIAVGKRGGYYGTPQERINVMLVEQAARGRMVVRLKGGDPTLFGRGGEEAIHLTRQGVEWELVPGVTSALAAPAAAGIPVTFRGIASSVAFVTGHEAPEKEQSAVRWEELARAVDTLVVLMPLAQLPRIVARLVQAGKSISTPAAVVASATSEAQRVVRAPLGAIAREVRQAGIASPALLVVGDVAGLAELLEGSASSSAAGDGLTGAARSSSA